VAARGEDDLVPAAGVLFGVFGGAVIPLSLEISPPQGSCPPIVKSAQRRTPGEWPARQSCNSGHRPDQCTTCWSTAQRTYMRNPSSRPRPGMPAVARYKLIWRSAANTSPATWHIAVSCTAGPVQLRQVPLRDASTTTVGLATPDCSRRPVCCDTGTSPGFKCGARRCRVRGYREISRFHDCCDLHQSISDSLPLQSREEHSESTVRAML